jgi:hypothetical protein
LRFVVTRADEFRRNRNAQLDSSNFDEQRLSAFLLEVIARLAKVTGLGLGMEPGDFFVIDNHEKFGVDAQEYTQSLLERAGELESERAQPEPDDDDYGGRWSGHSAVDDVRGMFEGLQSDLKDM